MRTFAVLPMSSYVECSKDFTPYSRSIPASPPHCEIALTSSFSDFRSCQLAAGTRDTTDGLLGARDGSPCKPDACTAISKRYGNIRNFLKLICSPRIQRYQKSTKARRVVDACLGKRPSLP